jgi:hypothetical protein
VEAIADGRRVAKAIDAYIRGEEFIGQTDTQEVVKLSAEDLKRRKERILKLQKMRTIPLEERVSSFDEVHTGYTEEMARKEAERCLFCAICSYCKQCEKVCDVSGLDYERILSASGPFGGHIKRLSDGRAPKKIAFIQCVGSRDADNPYCSSVCCMYGTKQAIVTKEHAPEIECKIFVMDVRAFGKGFDEYYERAKSKYGIQYVYTRPSCVRQNFKTHHLSLEYTEDGKNWREAGVKKNSTWWYCLRACVRRRRAQSWEKSAG